MGLLSKWKLGNDTNERFYFIFSNTIVLPAHYWTQHGFMSMEHFDIFTSFSWQRKLQVFVNGLQSFMLTYLGIDIATVSVGPKDYSCVKKIPWGWQQWGSKWMVLKLCKNITKFLRVWWCGSYWNWGLKDGLRKEEMVMRGQWSLTIMGVF